VLFSVTFLIYTNTKLIPGRYYWVACSICHARPNC